MINKETTYIDIQVLKLSATYSNCNIYDILGRKRNKIRAVNIITPRQISCYIFKNVFEYSLSHIGRILNRHHTTIINSLRAFENDMQYLDQEKIKRIIDKSYELL